MVEVFSIGIIVLSVAALLCFVVKSVLKNETNRTGQFPEMLREARRKREDGRTRGKPKGFNKEI